MCVSEKSRAEVVRVVLDRGAESIVKDDYGQTALSKVISRRERRKRFVEREMKRNPN